MAVPPCPVPSVAQALEPYIKPRHEVTRIRNELHGHLHSYVQTDGSPLTAVNLATTRHLNSHQQVPGTVTGVRKAYLRALQAHAAAQARYDALKADLDDLHGSTQPSSLPNSDQASVNETLIPLLQQKEKRRRLEVVEQTYSTILASGGDAVTAHLDDVIKQDAGDLPTPPTQQPPAFGEKPDVASRILQLKKDVLSTKRAIDNASAARLIDLSNGSMTGHGGDVAGLQEALNVLTSWMETQLATIGEAEHDAGHDLDAPATNGHEDSSTVRIEDISEHYNAYIAARESLVRTISHPQPLANEPISLSTPQPSNSIDRQDNNKSAAEILLPYLPTLTAAKQQEQSLLNQSSHLRKTVQTSEAKTQRLLTRLSEESHLVRPGAARGRDWAEAAAQAEAETTTFVREQVEDAERKAIESEETLGRVRELPEMVERVVEVRRKVICQR